MPRILFDGYYGRQNTGDDVFGLVSTWGAKEYWGVSNAFLLSSDGPKCKHFETKFAIPRNNKFLWGSKFKVISELVNSSHYILSGGSILHSKPRVQSLRRIAFELSKINLVNIGAIGVSLGPFKSMENENYIRQVLKRFSFLCLRDKFSYDLAKTYNLPYQPKLAADLAFLLAKMDGIKHIDNVNYQPVLGVIPCHYERFIKGDNRAEIEREKKVLETIRRLIKNFPDLNLRFFVFNGHKLVGDVEYVFKLISQLNLDKNKFELIPYSKNTLETYQKVYGCNVVLSTRLHGAILAAAADVPSVLIEYHKKCSNYLSDIGVSEQYRIGDFDRQVDEVVKLLSELLYSDIKSIYPNRKKLIGLSEQNFTSITI